MDHWIIPTVFTLYFLLDLDKKGSIRILSSFWSIEYVNVKKGEVAAQSLVSRQFGGRLGFVNPGTSERGRWSTAWSVVASHSAADNDDNNISDL